MRIESQCRRARLARQHHVAAPFYCDGRVHELEWPLVPTSKQVSIAASASAERATAARTHDLHLLWTFVRTDFKSRYHGTIGGFLWALLKPLAMFVVLLSVFSFVFSADGQYNANLLIGLFVFGFFGEASKPSCVRLSLPDPGAASIL